MKPEKIHATDYTPLEVEAAKRVMIEVAQNLGEYADACVVVGGWVPELLLPDAEPKHTGSIDGVKRKKNQPRRVPGFRVLEADGCALAFDDPTIVIIDGQMPDERRNRVSIRVASVADFLVMKGFALAGRDKPKDAYDIYFCVKNYPGGPTALAQALRLKLRRKDVRKGLEHIAGKFRSADDFGPATVVGFLDSADTDERQFQAQDAFGQIEHLLRELKKSEAKG